MTERSEVTAWPGQPLSTTDLQRLYPTTDHLPRLLDGMLNQIRKDRAIGFTDRHHGRPDLTLRLMQEIHRGTLNALHHDSNPAEQDAP